MDAVFLFLAIIGPVVAVWLARTPFWWLAGTLLLLATVPCLLLVVTATDGYDAYGLPFALGGVAVFLVSGIVVLALSGRAYRKARADKDGKHE